MKVTTLCPMESVSELEARHERELKELQVSIQSMLKGAKKSARAQLEAQAIQMQFDIKARHREELEELEEKIGGADALDAQMQELSVSAAEQAEAMRKKADEEAAQLKKAKAKKKQDKKASKDKEREEAKQQVRASQMGPTARDTEMTKLKEQLLADGFIIKDIAADGHCLYRALADQLLFTSEGGEDSLDHRALRRLAASHILSHAEDFAPFLELDAHQIPQYCERVASESLAEWGGHVELQALSDALSRQFHVFAAQTPVLVIGERFAGEPLRLSFHRHYYALGEHYNSVIPSSKKCSCDDHDH